MKQASAKTQAEMSVESPRWHAQSALAPELPLEIPDHAHQVVHLKPASSLRAIEDDAFPFEALSDIAEKESWRKEINRPTTHMHKWWAQRLGTVFRAMTIAAFAPSGSDILDLFYKPVRIPEGTVFDPFMGSGTTLAEAVKLGARAIGRDINPVAHFLVKCAFSSHDRSTILRTFRSIEQDVAKTLKSYYQTTLPDRAKADILYYFWVKTLDCPRCGGSVDLFSSMIFARHVYSKKFPRAQAVCPHCGDINEVHIDSRDVKCKSCAKSFDPDAGPATGQSATCPSCDHTFSIAKTARAAEKAPKHRLYAKLALLPDGNKEYLPATDEDRRLYAKAQHALFHRESAFPVVAIKPGHNTNQAIRYNYRYWHEMFNARQLLCLSILAERIRKVPNPVVRELFTCLFSGTLEFNNMFASYKGEGTGAVRHMFAHHILKPERVPLEANLWGTPKSSGSFSTMFENRIRRALDYADNPFELRLSAVKNGKTEKVYGLSQRIGSSIAENYADFAQGQPVYFSCGDSGSTDLPDRSVDVVLTDPPFFDNVHYSQLADFFHVWQRHILGENGYRHSDTTRSECEVQHVNAHDFTDRLSAVWLETKRILRDDGLLAFTYHHSRPEGWICVLKALMRTGFAITATQPIKAEMSVAMPKHQAKEPIDLDIIVVCRKRSRLNTRTWREGINNVTARSAQDQARRLSQAGRTLSRNDIRIIVMAQLLRRVSLAPSLDDAIDFLANANGKTEELIENIHSVCSNTKIQPI